jgi:ribosomal protein L11 methyltransferase
MLLAAYQPEWYAEEETDWIAETKLAWPARSVGERIFLAPVWNEDPTPLNRVRVVHNPGLASGTGEHPCTQLGLQALEIVVSAESVVADIGCGSGILAIAALQLGAQAAIALDTDEAALETARENFALNGLGANIAAGSADSVDSADIVIANISATVLVDIADELLRIAKKHLILTGFPESELAAIQKTFGDGDVTAINEWRCLSLRVS